MCGAPAYVGLWANSGHWPLFDHFVGTRQQRGRHGEAERRGGFQVDQDVLERFCNLPTRWPGQPTSEMGQNPNATRVPLCLLPPAAAMPPQ